MEKYSFHFLIKLLAFFILALFVMVAAAAFVPQEFPVGTRVRVAKNASLSGVADDLAQKNIVASAFLFKVMTTLLHGQNRIVAGDYQFDEPENLWTVMRRLATGEQGIAAIKVTIPEGSTVTGIAWILLQRIPDFNAPYFVKVASPFEGYLFPDTYHFYPNNTAEEILSVIRKNFDEKFRTLAMDVTLSKRKPADIVTMASIIEREASNLTDRAIISGILWKRLDEEMPLQVDATIVYLTGSGYVSLEDLKIDSPYNTYRNKGLPPGPISNPGISALRAAAQPVKTQYYYYLSDLKGVMHYAATFEGHQVNREKYLRK